MLHTILVVVHLLGAAVWVGGHIVLVRVVLPLALREQDPRRIVEFEHAFGKIGIGALVLQIGTGLALADPWLGGWQNIFSHPTPASHLVLTKLTLLALTLALALDATLRVLPRLDKARLRSFVVHAWGTTILAVLFLIVGAIIRLGGVR